MITRTRKNVPLHEKFGLFTEAPKHKKRIINIRTSRARDYTAEVDPEEVELDNVSQEEDPFSSGDDSWLGFDYSDEVEGMEDGLSTIDTSMSGNQTGGEDSEGDGETLGTNAMPAGNGDSEGTDRTASPDIQDGTSGNVATDGSAGTEMQPDEVSTDTTSSPRTSSAGGEGQADDSTGGDQSVQTSAGSTNASGDPGDAGASGNTGEDQANSDGSGDVVPQEGDQESDANNEVIEIEDPSADDDFTAGVDSGDNVGDGIDDPSIADPGAENPATSDPTGVDSNAGVNADLEAFDKNDMRKYQLFKRYIDLHDVTIHFVSTLEAIISDDTDYGVVISNVTKKLKKIEGILKDYMIIKFQADSYLQNSFFFEKSKTAILIALETLKRGKKQKTDSKQ